MAPATIRDYSNIVKSVVASAIDEKGEQRFPRTWNEEFIDAPLVKHQNQPSTDKKGMESILKEAAGQYRVLYALLAGCGPLRAQGKRSVLRSANISPKTAALCMCVRKRSAA